MNIFCRVEDCRYMECGFCKRGDISISEDLECEDYESYLDTQEWRKPFWKRMFDHTNNCVCRVMHYGKEIEIKGRKFFVETKSEYAYITDADTGFGCGKLAYAQDNIDKIIEKANEVETPLKDLPVATYDEKSREFNYEVKGGEG